MTAETSHQLPIELPGLIDSRVDLFSGDFFIGTGRSDSANSQLILEGDEDAFEHTFNNGKLTLNEKSSGDGNITLISGGGSSSIFIGNVTGSSIIVNGRDVLAGDRTNISGTPRKATLLLPTGHQGSHYIKTISGDVELESLVAKELRIVTTSGDIDIEGLTARELKIVSTSGEIAINGAQSESIEMKTTSGDIDIDEMKSQKGVSAKTISGNVDLTDSEAPSWELGTVSGNIKVKATQGKVNAKSVSGRVKIS
jgi:hypothetical protein